VGAVGVGVGGIMDSSPAPKCSTFLLVFYKRCTLALTGVCGILLAVVVLLAMRDESTTASFATGARATKPMSADNSDYDPLLYGCNGPTLPPPTKTYTWNITASVSGTAQVNEIALFNSNGKRMWPEDVDAVSLEDSHGNTLPNLLDGTTWNKSWFHPLPVAIIIKLKTPKQISGFGFVYGDKPQDVPVAWTWVAGASQVGMGEDVTIQEAFAFSPDPVGGPTLTSVSMPFTNPAAILDFDAIPSNANASPPPVPCERV